MTPGAISSVAVWSPGFAVHSTDNICLLLLTPPYNSIYYSRSKQNCDIGGKKQRNKNKGKDGAGGAM